MWPHHIFQTCPSLVCGQLSRISVSPLCLTLSDFKYVCAPPCLCTLLLLSTDSKPYLYLPYLLTQSQPDYGTSEDHLSGLEVQLFSHRNHHQSNKHCGTRKVSSHFRKAMKRVSMKVKGFTLQSAIDLPRIQSSKCTFSVRYLLLTPTTESLQLTCSCPPHWSRLFLSPRYHRT